MATVYYAKVIVTHGTFEDYRRQLLALAGPGIDVGVLQVGVHEALVRPHLLRHLRSKNPGLTLDELLRHAGANRIDWVKQSDVHTLYLQRIEEDLDPKADIPAPDALGGRSWHHQATDVAAAWAAVGGPDAIDWQGVRVGQLDTGYTRHKAWGHGEPGGTWVDEGQCRTFMSDLLPPGWLPPAAAGVVPGVDTMPFGGLFQGHGTRIGTTISGHLVVDGNDTFRGVAPWVPHVVVRITDSVGINDRQQEFADGLRYLVDVAQVDVVNVSLGVFPPVVAPAMRQALAHARARGVIVVCAAGNHVDPVVPPASLPETIAVAATTWQNLPWHGSSFGPEVDFCAPGAVITKAVAVRNGLGTDIRGTGNGTSYAAAITSGAAALWLRRWGPQIQAQYGRTPQRVEAFRRAAVASCYPPPAGWKPAPFGAGILNIGRLCTNPALALPAMV
jgi:subtilisin family serine protease